MNQFYAWKTKLKLEQPRFEEVTKIEPKVEPPRELTVDELLEKLHAKCDNFIFITEVGNGHFINKIKGNQAQYKYLLTLLALQASRHFNLRKEGIELDQGSPPAKAG